VTSKGLSELYRTVDQAIAVVVKCKGEIQVARDRLTALLNSNNPTEADFKQMAKEVSRLESLMQRAHQEIGESMDAVDHGQNLLQGYTNRNTGRSVVRSGQSWEIQGMERNRNTELASQLPVMPTGKSIRMHEVLIEKYKGKIAAAEKTLEDYRKGSSATDAEVKEIEEKIGWWKNEIDQTQVSLGHAEKFMTKFTVKPRDEALVRYGQLKTDYDRMCLELSTIKDNGVYRSQARADELDTMISDLEVSMKIEMAIVAQADATLAR
jgi:chromosome segregation ATPase